MKRIAIVGSAAGSSWFGIGKNYYEFIDMFGAPEIIPPNISNERARELAEEVDLLILPGGADLSASLYGEDPSVFNTNPDLMKEHFFRTKLKYFVEAETPIFGICLGFQMLNVYFGGKLTQHVNTKIHQSDARWSPSHKVRAMSRAMWVEPFEVNSHHHQAVRPSDLSKEMDAILFSEEHEKNPSSQPKRPLIEAIRHKSLPIAGVQWHPEEFYDEFSINMIQSIIEKGKKKRSEKWKKEEKL